MLTTDQPAAATVSVTQSLVNPTRRTPQAADTAGLRRNFQPLKPSTGASFHAPPTAVSQPPTLATTSAVQTGSGGNAAWMPSVTRQAATRPTAIVAPAAYRRTRSSIVLPWRASRIGI